MKKFKVLLLVLSIFTVNVNSQECNEFFNFSKYSNCTKCIKANYKIYQQPIHTKVNINDTLSYNVVFYGGRDYLISFCTDQLYYPLNIRLLNPHTKEVLYNNTNDYYLETIGVGIYNTQSLVLELIFIADNLDENVRKNNDKICVGMILQSKKILSKSNKLYLKY